MEGQEWGGTALIVVQCCKAQCTMDQCLQMIGPPPAIHSLKSPSTASPDISLRLPLSRQQTACCSLLAVNAVRTTYRELLQYIGMMMLMSCYMKLLDYFWRTVARMGDCSEDEKNDMLLFTFNRYMSRRRYLAITSACGLPPNHHHRSETSFGRFGI